MMNFLPPVLTVLLLLLTNIGFGQMDFDFNYEELTVEKRDSIHHLLIAHNQKQYRQFQLLLPQKRKNKIVANALVGGLIGTLSGLVVEGTGRAVCDVAIFPISVFTGESCPSEATKYGIIGGLIGTGIGLTIGLNKANKIRFYPKRIY
ncbi:MAG: hypothetical protein AAGJ18_13850 [Bacteroidota bacterium]